MSNIIGYFIIPVYYNAESLEELYERVTNLTQSHPSLDLEILFIDDGSGDIKIKAIEDFDSQIVGPVWEELERKGEPYTILLMPDHPTPVTTGQHARDPVPVAIRRPGEQPDATQRYDEEHAGRGALGLLEGEGLIRTVLGFPA